MFMGRFEYLADIKKQTEELAKKITKDNDEIKAETAMVNMDRTFAPSKEYIKAAIRTEAPITDELEGRLCAAARLLHGGMGLVTEAGEFMDGLKKNVFYGKELDKANLVEELGDLFWYLALICDDLEVTFEEIMEINRRKLLKRYPEKFTQDKALNRDLDAERVELEQKAFATVAKGQEMELDKNTMPCPVCFGGAGATCVVCNGLGFTTMSRLLEYDSKVRIESLPENFRDMTEIAITKACVDEYAQRVTAMVAGSIESSKWPEFHGPGVTRRIETMLHKMFADRDEAVATMRKHTVNA